MNNIQQWCHEECKRLCIQEWDSDKFPGKCSEECCIDKECKYEHTGYTDRG